MTNAIEDIQRGIYLLTAEESTYWCSIVKFNAETLQKSRHRSTTFPNYMAFILITIITTTWKCNRLDDNQLLNGL